MVQDVVQGFKVLVDDGRKFVVPEVLASLPMYEVYKKEEGVVMGASIGEVYYSLEHEEDLTRPLLPNELVGKTITSIKETSEGDYFLYTSDGLSIYCSIHKVIKE